ncbi:MAG: VWA domain-containing protein [Herpetosiphonaceae bacterium]|nr:VWA domain-containing protein [Herpetosiphonaceae bacterium]
MGGEVALRSSLGRPQLVANTQQVVYLLIELMPTAVVAQVQMPVAVMFVLDHSGSMDGAKIKAVRDATSIALDVLQPEDSIGVIAFNHQHSVLVPHQPVKNVQQIKAKISQLKADGGTHIGTALAAALKEIGQARAGMLRRVILLTDGETADDEDECLRQADKAGQSDISIMALGVGDDWNATLLHEIGNRSANGKADYINEPAKLLEYFKTSIQSAQAAVVQNAMLTMRMTPGIALRAAWQVIPLIANLPSRPLDDRSLTISLGELEKGQGQTLLVELTVAAKPVGTFRIGQLDLQYDIPAAHLQAEHVRADVLLTFTDQAAALQAVDPRVMNIAEKVSAHKLQTRALQDIEAGNIAGATQKLQSAVTRLLNQGEADLAQSLQQEVDHLQQQGQMTAAGQKTIKFSSRKTVRLSDLDPSKLKP